MIFIRNKPNTGFVSQGRKPPAQPVDDIDRSNAECEDNEDANDGRGCSIGCQNVFYL